MLALELVSDPSVTTSPGQFGFVFDAAKEILLLHILVVCLIFYQPIVQSQLSVALGLQLTEAPSVTSGGGLWQASHPMFTWKLTIPGRGGQYLL